MLQSQVILELWRVKLMETTVLKAKTVTLLALISSIFDMQIHFYFPDYSTAPPWFESRVTMLCKFMKTAE